MPCFDLVQLLLSSNVYHFFHPSIHPSLISGRRGTDVFACAIAGAAAQSWGDTIRGERGRFVLFLFMLLSFIVVLRTARCVIGLVVILDAGAEGARGRRRRRGAA
jgi:hypothetical protein